MGQEETSLAKLQIWFLLGFFRKEKMLEGRGFQSLSHRKDFLKLKQAPSKTYTPFGILQVRFLKTCTLSTLENFREEDKLKHAIDYLRGLQGKELEERFLRMCGRVFSPLEVEHIRLCFAQLGKQAFQGDFLGLWKSHVGSVKLGLIVTRKVGKAPCRNHIRRRLKEGFSWALEESVKDIMREKALGRISLAWSVPDSHWVVIPKKEAYNHLFGSLKVSLYKKMFSFFSKNMLT